MTKPLSPQLTLAAILALAGAIFLLDLVTVFGVSVPTLYLTVLLLATRSPAWLFGTAAGCSLLTAIGAHFSPPGPTSHVGWLHDVVYMGWLNRIITLSAIWLAVGILTGRARAQRDLLQSEEQSKRAEAEAQRQEGWLRGLIQATQDAVVSIDRRGRIVLFNPAAERIFGYAREEVCGQPVQVLMPEPYRGEHDEYLARYERTGQARAIGRIRTVTAQRKDGATFPIELSVTEITEDSDVHYAAFIRDISDKVQMQERLLEKERLATIGTTAAKLAHEIGNPLNGMSLAVQILKRRVARHGGAVSEQLTPHVLSLTGSINRLIQLLQEFRSLSRRQRFVFQPFSLRGLIDEVLCVEGPGYAALGVQVEHVLKEGDEVPPVQGDRDKLRQVLLNLCKNAVEAMPQGGKLTISAQGVGAQVLLSVADTGTGIPEGVDVFEPFVTTKEDGTGLGLPVVQQIIDAHGGVIRYVSTPGKGTKFTVVLPRADAPPAPHRLPAQA